MQIESLKIQRDNMIDESWQVTMLRGYVLLSKKESMDLTVYDCMMLKMMISQNVIKHNMEWGLGG